ncbi:MAG: NUDIX hydrolase [Acetivibrio sp.]
MAAFLKDITPFIGTGEKNEDGLTLEEFLEEYHPEKYKNPCSTTDILVIRKNGRIQSIETGLKLLMIKRRNHPSIGLWALPGGFVEIEEDLEAGAKRELEEETGLKGIPLEQMRTWGEAFRDPRARVITTSYLAVVEDTLWQVKAGDDAKEAVWMDVVIKKISSQEVLEERGERIKEIYELLLTEEETKEELCSKVLVSYNKTGILREMEYKVISNQGIAFDHPRVIVQALLYIKRNIKEK